MNISVYANSYAWLFRNPCGRGRGRDVVERTWSLGRFPKPVKPGDALIFRSDGLIVARAVCSAVSAPGERDCLMHDGTRELRGHKVHWLPGTFEDLRDKPDVVAEIERQQREARKARARARAQAIESKARR